VKTQEGFATGMAPDLQPKPREGFADSGTEGLGGGLFGGEPCRQMGSRTGLRTRVSDFGWKKDLLKETIAEFGDRFLDAGDFHQIRSESNHSLWLHDF